MMVEAKRQLESEEQIVARAQDAVSLCRWVVGECAAVWTARYARGRTDGDFAVLIGISGDQVYQRRRVWETFHEIREEFPKLKWSHFYAALNWDDARDCLSWAEDTQSTVAEMRAWRRAQRGEDLSVAGVEEDAVQFVPSQPEFVQDVGEMSGGVSIGASRGTGSSDDPDHVVHAGVARQAGLDGNEYAPFRSGAASVPGTQSGNERQSTSSEPVTTEQLAKRFASAVEKFVKLMTPEFRREFWELPGPVKEKFLSAISDLRDRVAQLK
jgi:hypothetical protein